MCDRRNLKYGPGAGRPVDLYYPIEKYTANGEAVFCIEPGVDMNGSGTPVSIEDYPYAKPNEEESKQMALISYYGYVKSSYPERARRAYTQLYIWELCGCTIHWITDTRGEASMAGYNEWKQSVNEQIANHAPQPSWHNQTITINRGQTIVLQDTTNATQRLEDIHMNDTGVEVRRDGNTVTLTAGPNVKSGTIQWNKVRGSFIGSPIIYQSGGQDTMLMRDPDRVKAGLNIQVPNEIQFKKKLETGVSGQANQALFELRDSSGWTVPLNWDPSLNAYFPAELGDKNAIKQWNTTPDGTVRIQGLYDHNFSIHEVQAPTGYFLYPKPVDATVNAASRPRAQVSMNNYRQYVQLRIVKQDGERQIPLAGAKFRIQFTGDPSSAYYRTTNAKGEITTASFRVGDRVSIIEVSPPLGYKLPDNPETQIVVSGDNSGDLTEKMLEKTVFLRNFSQNQLVY